MNGMTALEKEPETEPCCSCRRAHWEDLGLHGVRRLIRARGSCVKSTFWVLLILLAASSLAFNVANFLFRFLSAPLVTSYRLVDVEEAHGPSLILCNLNSMRLSVLYEEEWFQSLQELYSGGGSQLRRAGDMSSREVFTRAGHEIDNMLLRCHHTSGLCDGHNFTMILTEHGLCHTVPKIGHGQLDLLLNVERYEYSGLATDRVGLLMILYDQNGHPLLSPHYVTAAPGVHTDVEITTARMKRLAEGGVCGNTSSSCLATCMKARVKARCGCLPYWAATGNAVKEDGPVCKMHSNYLCADKEISKARTDGTERDQCQCQPGCDVTAFSTSILQAGLDGADHMRYLSETQEYVISTAKMASENVRFRADLEEPRGRAAEDDSGPSVTVHDLSALSRAIDDLRYQIETLKRNIHQVRQNLDLIDEQLERRTWFHFQIGLNGLERTIRHGFVPQWEVALSQYLEPLIGGTQILLLQFDSAVKKLDRAASSEPSMRRTLYLTTEELLSARMELAIQGLDNYTKVYYSLSKMEPSTAYILTPQRRYDAALLPVVSMSDISEALREEYGIIADHLARYMDLTLTLRNILKDVYLANAALNTTQYQNVRTAFTQRNRNLQTHVALFREKVMVRLTEGLERQSDHFKKLNATYFSTSAKLSGLLLDATEHLDRISLYNYPHLVEFAQDAQLYVSNDAKLMSELVEEGLTNNAVGESVDSLLHNIQRFRATDGAAQTLWQKYTEQSLQLWVAMLGNGNLAPFYAKLNADVQTMMQSPLEAPSLRELFGHNKLLGKTESEISEIDPDDFYFLMNADFPLTNEHGKDVELRETVGRYQRLTDISLQLQDLDKTIGRSYRALGSVLERFRKNARLGGQFVSESLVSISLRLAAVGHDEVTEYLAYPLTKLLTDIGLLMPLYLGASVLSFIEALDILCSCICCKHKNKADTSSPSSSQYGLKPTSGPGGVLDDVAHLEQTSPSAQSSPRHVTFHIPEAGNHVGHSPGATSPTRSTLKRPPPGVGRPNELCQQQQGPQDVMTTTYYPNDTRHHERIAAYHDVPVEML